MSAPGSARERSLGAALRGAALGAVLGFLGHVGALIASAEGAPHDETTRRVSAELARLASENTRFALALLLAVMLAAGLAGAGVAFLLQLCAPRLRRSRVLVELGATAGVLALLVLRAFVRQPALLEPSLGGARGALAPGLARLAVTVSPHAVDALLLALCLVPLALATSRHRAAIFRRRKPSPGLKIGAAFAIAILLAFAIARWPRRPAAKLLILAADSLRPDRLSPLRTPNLSALAARGVSFDAALSPIARTTPSWISILTGLYPHSHGVRHMFPRRELRPAYLDYLPRRLGEAGYRTSVISDYAGDFFPLFDLGFQRARLPPPLTLSLVFEREVMVRSPLALALLNHAPGRALFPVLRFLMTNADPDRLADEILDELTHGDARPRAVVAFFSTTHVPFAAPWPYYRAASPTYGGPHRYAYDVQRLSDVTASESTAMPAADVAQIRALYDASLASVDAAMGRILAQVGDDTLVVVLSDHGENLFEPGTTTHHGKWFRGGDEANRVPLLFAGPGVRRGATVAEPVSLVDVAPTVAALLGLPPQPADGRSLADALTGRAPLAARDVFAETGEWLNGPATPDGVPYPPLTELLEADPDDHFQLVLKPRYEDVVVEAKHRMLRHGTQKLIYIPTRDGVRYELYDLSVDPTQTTDRQAGAPEAPALERAIEKFLARDPERELDARGHLQRRTED
jgi:arylsulfatase A-like enzyme